MEKITALRRKIDDVDEKMLLLLKERIEISRKIGEIKRKQGIPVKDLGREEEKFKQVKEKALKLGLDPEDVMNIFRKIMDMSISVQEA